VRQRLETRYRGRARFDVVTAPSQGFVARLSLPVHTSAYAAPATT
jgi:hypothetical protein